MPFYLYKREEREEDGIVKECFEKIKEVKLAGYNAIYHLWEQRGKPINEGWHITTDELIKELNNGEGDSNSYRLIIDFDPRAKWRIALIEFLDIYLYTYGVKDTGTVWWTPLMPKIRDIKKELDKEIDLEEKKKIQNSFCIPKREESEDKDIFEFIYLRDDWNWGRVGQVNAPFLYKDAREFFKKFF